MRHEQHDGVIALGVMDGHPTIFTYLQDTSGEILGKFTSEIEVNFPGQCPFIVHEAERTGSGKEPRILACVCFKDTNMSPSSEQRHLHTFKRCLVHSGAMANPMISVLHKGVTRPHDIR